MTHTFKKITIKPLTPKWKSRVAQFGDKWWIFRENGNKLLITEKIVQSRCFVEGLERLGSIGSWVEDGKEIEIIA